MEDSKRTYGRARDALAKFRCSREELEAMRDAAAAAGLTFSEWARRACAAAQKANDPDGL